MEDLVIEKSKDTFEIICNAKNGCVDIRGASYPEDSIGFFQPLYDWIEKYLAEERNSIIFNFIVDYLNSSSSKCIFDLLDILEEHHEEFGNVKVNWFYNKDDRDMLELGRDFCEEMELPFELITK